MKVNMFDVREFCRPAQVYMIFSFVYVIIHLFLMMLSRNLVAEHTGVVSHPIYPMVGSLFNIVIIFGWALLLNYVCKRYKTHGYLISWGLAFIPILLHVGVIVGGLTSAIPVSDSQQETPEEDE